MTNVIDLKRLHWAKLQLARAGILSPALRRRSPKKPDTYILKFKEAEMLLLATEFEWHENSQLHLLGHPHCGKRQLTIVDIHIANIEWGSNNTEQVGPSTDPICVMRGGRPPYLALGSRPLEEVAGVQFLEGEV